MQDWISLFLEETEGINSPQLLRLWGAIAAVSGVLERKVWIMSNKKPVFPNTYIGLIAPSAGGKTEVTKRVDFLWREVPDINVAPSSVTKASLVDELSAGTRVITRPLENPPQLSFNSVLICSSEMGVLLPSYDLEFMATLTDLYDCGGYSETRRSRKSDPINIRRSHVSMVAAATPAYLKETLPEGAWDQGFISRTFLIFSGEKRPIQVDLETGDEEQSIDSATSKSDDKLQSGLNEISRLVGKMTFTDEAKNRFINWIKNGQEPKPTHPKLKGYCERRYIHLVKLSMIACASETRDYLITEDHFDRALSWMTEAEQAMPDIFKTMRSGGDSSVIEDTFHYVYDTYIREKRTPVVEERVYAYIQQQTHSYNVDNILNSMVRQGLLKKEFVTVKNKTKTGYRPFDKTRM